MSGNALKMPVGKNGTAPKPNAENSTSAKPAPIEKTIVTTIEQIKKQTERRSQIIDTLEHMQASISPLWYFGCMLLPIIGI